MKKRFLKFLPIVADLLLATSCSKDDDSTPAAVSEPSATEPATVEVAAQPEYVKIPFSVKVDSGTKLSKISYSGDGTSITRSFEDSEVDHLTMTVKGEGIKDSELTLKKVDGNLVFDGEISVESGQETAFASGITLTGTFGNALTEVKTSTESLLKLMQGCNHEYMATFQSCTTEPITFYDQNAYFHFTLAPTQTKFDLEIGGTKNTFSSFSASHEIWIAVVGGTTVKGNLVSTSGLTTAASKIYNANRTDVVDLGLTSGILWMTHNLGATNPGDYGNYYTWGDTQGYGSSGHNFNSENYSITKFSDAATAALGSTYRMPTKEELNTLTSGTYKSADASGYSVAGLLYSTDYGSVFLPAAGACYDNEYKYGGGSGVYWSKTLDDNYATKAWYLDFYYQNSETKTEIENNIRYYGRTIRVVRSL